MLNHLLPFSEQDAADLLRDPETYATVLLIIVLAAYREDIFGDPEQDIDPVDPLELWARIEEDFRVRIPEENENKLQALMFAMSTNAFFEDPLAFISISIALHDGELGDLVTGAMEDLTVPELLWGVYEVTLNREGVTPFSLAVQSVIDETITDEAEENDQLEKEEVVPYYERFVETSKKELLSQCQQLKLPDTIIAAIAAGNQQS